MFKDRRKMFEVLILMFCIIATIKWLLPVVRSDEFKIFLDNIGFLGPFIIILLTVILHVFAPETATIIMVISFATYGVVQTMFYLYLASIISAAVSFKISRRYGKTIISKIKGPKRLKRIEKLKKLSSDKMLIAGRTFGFMIFETISYAAGLTNITFKKYMFITILFGAIPNLVAMIILKDADISEPINFFIVFGGLLFLGLGFSLALKNYVDKNINN